MCGLYNSLDVLIPSQHKSYDVCSSAESPKVDAYLEQGEQAHRLVKRLYGRTNKRNATMQIGRHVRRIERAQLAAERQQLKTQSEMRGVSIEETADQYLDQRYNMSNSRNDPVDLYSFVHEHQGDPAFKAFIPKLKDNILGRLLERNYEGDMYSEFTDQERNTVRIAGDQIYRCKTVKINYTTYDIRRDGDTINTRTYPDIMVTSPETGPNAQPYWYARVIGIFHAMVSSTHPELEGAARSRHRMDFLWVRWFGMEPGQYRHGFQFGRLPKIGFVESTDNYAFTFLDPAQVIRGAHLIPTFAEGRTSGLLPAKKSIAHILNPNEEDDWVNFYVNM